MRHLITTILVFIATLALFVGSGLSSQFAVFGSILLSLTALYLSIKPHFPRKWVKLTSYKSITKNGKLVHVVEMAFRDKEALKFFVIGLEKLDTRLNREHFILYWSGGYEYFVLRIEDKQHTYKDAAQCLKDLLALKVN